LNCTRLDRTLERFVRDLGTHLHATDARLHALSPLEVLHRGYALVQNANGVLVHSAAQIGPGDLVRTRLSDGSFSSRVEPESATDPPPKRRLRKR
jgi:exodeoxyribonuclease VII large subunit